MDRDATDAMPGPEPDDFSAEYRDVAAMLSGRLHFPALGRAINESVSDPTPSETDRRIERICKAYLAGTDQQRAQYRREVKNGASLMHYSKRMAVRAMRNADADVLDLAGAALSLEDKRGDPRETITDLAILRHVAIKISVDWNPLLHKIEAMSSPEMGQFVRGFAARDASSLRLELFLHCETHDANGPTIELQAPVARSHPRSGIPPGCGQIDIPGG